MGNANRSRLVAGVAGAVLVVVTAGVVIVVATSADDGDSRREPPPRAVAAPGVSTTLPEPPAPSPPSTQPPAPEPRNAGILGAQRQGDAFAALTGTADLGDDAIYAGLIGPPTHAPARVGTGNAKIVIGQIGVAPDDTSPGELDKAIVRRYVKRRSAQLLYCYEKELLARPSLAGTVTARFTIRADGQTGTATASGVHPPVASCIEDILGRIAFPRPKHDGAVIANATFTFTPT